MFVFIFLVVFSDYPALAALIPLFFVRKYPLGLISGQNKIPKTLDTLSKKRSDKDIAEMFSHNRPPKWTKQQHAHDAVKKWYKGIDNFDRDALAEDCKDFAQLVWKSTTKMGAGFAMSRFHITYLVAYFSPAIHDMGREKNNGVKENVIHVEPISDVSELHGDGVAS